MSVIVSIALHGLIALVPGHVVNGTLTPGGVGAEHMAALLVDAHDTSALPQTIKCIVHHDPKLEFPIPDSSVSTCVLELGCKALPPKGSAPRRCSCSPMGKRIWLTPDETPAASSFKKWASLEVPAKKQKPDFSYFPNLAQLGFHLDPEVLKSGKNLAAQMIFPFSKLTVCGLATRPSEEPMNDNVHSFGFRKLNDDPDPKQPHQAVAQRLIAKHTFTITTDQLQLHLGSFDGTHEAAITLASSGTVDIELSNERPHLAVDDPCNDGIGRDFALFYHLDVNSSQDWRAVPLPHVVPAKSVPAKDVEDSDCSEGPMKGMMSRPICTMPSYIE